MEGGEGEIEARGKKEFEAMKRLPPLLFSPPPAHDLSVEVGGFTVSPALLNTLAHCSDCAARKQ